MKEARYSQLSPRDFFPENVRKEHILAPYEVPKWLYYLDRSKEVALEKLEDGIKATDLRVPKTEDQFLNSIDHHRKHNHSSIYLTLFGAYEEVLHWAKSHAKNAKSECQIWRIDGERLRGESLFLLGADLNATAESNANEKQITSTLSLILSMLARWVARNLST